MYRCALDGEQVFYFGLPVYFRILRHVPNIGMIRPHYQIMLPVLIFADTMQDTLLCSPNRKKIVRSAINCFDTVPCVISSHLIDFNELICDSK